MSAMGWIGSNDIVILIGVTGNEGLPMGGCKVCKTGQKSKVKKISKNCLKIMKKK